MTPSKLMVLIAAPVLMVGACIGVTGIEAWLAGFGTSLQAQQTLGRIGLALPYVIAAAIGVIFLFAARGAVAIRGDTIVQIGPEAEVARAFPGAVETIDCEGRLITLARDPCEDHRK